jgi:hypothetical protein
MRGRRRRWLLLAFVDYLRAPAVANNPQTSIEAAAL